MAEAENPRAIMGGNEPPPDVDPLIVEANERIDTANRYLVERADIDKWDKEMADKVNAFTGQVQGTHKALDGQRLDENRAHLAKQDAKYKSPLALLLAATTKLQDLRRSYLKKEEAKLEAERKAKEEAARIAQEEADAIAAKAALLAKRKGADVLRIEAEALSAQVAADDAAAAAETAPVHARISGTYSARATGLKDKWSAEITDLSAAFKNYNRKDHPSKPILEKAIRDCIKSLADKEAVALKDLTKAPPGISFRKDRV